MQGYTTSPGVQDSPHPGRAYITGLDVERMPRF